MADSEFYLMKGSELEHSSGTHAYIQGGKKEAVITSHRFCLQATALSIN